MNCTGCSEAVTSIRMSTEIHMERTAWAVGLNWPRLNRKHRFVWNTLYVASEFKGVNLCGTVELTRGKKLEDVRLEWPRWR